MRTTHSTAATHSSRVSCILRAFVTFDRVSPSPRRSVHRSRHRSPRRSPDRHRSRDHRSMGRGGGPFRGGSSQRSNHSAKDANQRTFRVNTLENISVDVSAVTSAHSSTWKRSNQTSKRENGRCGESRALVLNLFDQYAPDLRSCHHTEQRRSYLYLFLTPFGP